MESVFFLNTVIILDLRVGLELHALGVHIKIENIVI